MADAAPTCGCGYGLDHVMVSQVPDYTAWQSFCVFFLGVSASPRRIEYQCRVCREVFHTTTDPEVLEGYR